MVDFEKKLKRLEEIVHKMEKGDLSLEESLKIFEEGVKLSRECNTKLGEAEAQVKILIGQNADGSDKLENFES